HSGLLARLNMYIDAADHAWQEWVVSYDLNHQAAMAAKFEAALRRWKRPRAASNRTWQALVITGVKRWGAAILAALLFLTALPLFGPRLWREWRKRAHLRRIVRYGASPSDAGILYQRMLEILARRGFEKPAWFTPIEFARHLPGDEGGRVVEFTEVYNSIRFGGDSAAAVRLAELLQDFERPGRDRPVDHLAIH
ncbi:MAG TPA: DUF4129 domain-containing protein, partial [Bryobacteraceae bacterium]|nr:DUF4129 domain-containing protein [Bryobacteraceae bacterium]